MPANDTEDRRADGAVDARHDDSPSLEQLSSFQRDVLVVLEDIDDPRLSGVELKRELASYYDDEITLASLYQNLRDLVDRGFVETRPIDGRTNAYRVSRAGHDWLVAYRDWMSRCLGDEDDRSESDSSPSR